MNGGIDSRLARLGIVLPPAPASQANYVPYVVTGNLVHVSGQLPFGPDGLEYSGRIGAELSLEDGQKAARLCAINLIAQVREPCGGDLKRVRRVVRLGGFINCTAGFTDHPALMNGASDLMVEVFGEVGRHARFAVGCPSLPLNAAVEIDGIFEIY